MTLTTTPQSKRAPEAAARTQQEVNLADESISSPFTRAQTSSGIDIGSFANRIREGLELRLEQRMRAGESVGGQFPHSVFQEVLKEAVGEAIRIASLCPEELPEVHGGDQAELVAAA